MDLEIVITPEDIAKARQAIDSWIQNNPWERIRIAIEYEETISVVLPKITKYKEWFPCCSEAASNPQAWSVTLNQLVHFCSWEHHIWRYEISLARFKEAEKCIKVMEVLDGKA